MTNLMMHSIQPTFHKAPKAFDGIRVSRTVDIDLSGVMNPIVGVTLLFKTVVARQFIGEHRRFRKNASFNKRDESYSLDIRDDLSANFAFALDCSSDYRLASGSTSALPRASTSNISFVNFDLPIKRVDVLSHELPNLGEHSPSCLIGDSQLSFELLGRNPCSCISHQEDSVEPGAQRGWRLVQDCPRRWRKLIAATVALVGFTALNAVELVGRPAIRALNLCKPAAIPQKFKAGILGWKLFIELFDCVPLHRANLLSVTTERSIAGALYVVKG